MMGTEFLYKDLTYKVIGSLFEAHKRLGPVHKENIYHEAIKIEFDLQGIKYTEQKSLDVVYKDKKIGVYRPDFIILDDIDTDFSVASIQGIDKTYRWLKWEFLGSLSDNCQIVFLWNIIKNEWCIIRFEKDYWNSNKWIIRRKAIIENWLITWPQRFTPEMIEEKRAML